MDPLPSPVCVEPPEDVQCCEHCLTVTWAGVPACGCEFGRLSVSESAVEVLYSVGAS
jgi:hypothetical protein